MLLQYCRCLLTLRSWKQFYMVALGLLRSKAEREIQQLEVYLVKSSQKLIAAVLFHRQAATEVIGSDHEQTLAQILSK